MKLVILIGVLAFSGTANAQEREFYAGIGGGTNFKSGPVGIEFPLDPAQTVTAVIDDSDSNFRVYGGY